MSLYQTLHELPRYADGWSFLYIEKSRVERDNNAVTFTHPAGEISVPSAMLASLLLGPGTTISHAAVTLLGDSGTTITWVGQGVTKVYAAGTPSDRSTRNLLHHVAVWASEESRMEIVRRMYLMRFDEPLDPSLVCNRSAARRGFACGTLTHG